MILNVDRFCSLSLATLVAALLATPGDAALIGFEAEDGASATTTVTASLGADFDPAQADAGASGGAHITSETNGGSDNPGTAERVVSYDIAVPEAGTYDLYGRLWIGSNPGNDDSMFYGSGFGSKALSGGDWITLNGLYDTFSPVGDIEKYIWINLTAETGDFGEAGVTFTAAAAGTETFQIGAREDGLRMDAFAFGTSGDTFTDAQLDFAVTGIPEPASLALLLLGGMALAGIRR